jgi:phosphoribosylformimino-5-aminoimidazole carboxamide ribotide isomerase
VILGTAALADPALLAAACRRFGDAVAAALDARDGEVRVEGWVAPTGTAAAAAAARMVAAGARRIVYTDIGPDGTFAGPDVERLRALLLAAGVPVIAAGGIASVAHIARLRPLETLGLEGVIVGRALYEGRVDFAGLVAAAGSAEPPCSPGA